MTVIDQPSADPITLQNNEVLRSGILNENISADAGIDLSKLESGPWDTWTPAITASTTNPTGWSTGGLYTIQGQNTCHAVGYLPFGSTAGTGTYRFSLPVAARAAVNILGGTAAFWDSSVARLYACVPRLQSATAMELWTLSINFGGSTWTWAVATSTFPATPAASDFFEFAITYETT